VTTQEPTYNRLTLTAAVQLMAPQTWVAAIAPVVIGTALAIGTGAWTPLTLLASPRAIAVVLLMLVTACAAQSAVNTLNDYVDFQAGTDTADNVVDVTDQALIYHRLNPRSARNLAITCLFIALVCGLTVTALSNAPIPTLLLGLLGLAAVLTYSAGPAPISTLPLGEVVSGTVMGIAITAATVLALTGRLPFIAAVATLVPFITIALIMQTNNTNDIARDIEAGRRTLPIYLGESRSASLIATGNVVALAIAFALCLARWRFGTPVVLVAAALSYGNIRLLATGPYGPENRPRLMQAIVRQAAIINYLFALSILLGAHFA
jgi:1,4-dihydroxy-2-naphthoate octaprenyltransferase